jgi:hypothetical protein
VGKQILATIEISGSTINYESFTFKPFTYPVEICSGCLTMCDSQLKAQHLTREQALKPSTCDDNSGNDDRICIASDC